MPDHPPAPDVPVTMPDRAALLGVVRVAAASLDVDDAAWCAAAERATWIERAAGVLEANLASGRIEAAARYRSGGHDRGAGLDSALVPYARQVLVELCAEFELIQRLREGEPGCWETVIDRARRLAYFRLRRAGPDEWARAEAQDAAAYTVEQMWVWLGANDYPFDVPFDRWATRWLNNRLLERARREQTREKHTAGSLDSPLASAEGQTMQDVLPDHSHEEWMERMAVREALSQAIDKLPPRLATVVRLWYFEEWTADEIAAFIGKRTPYVYVLRFRAIDRLKDMAADERSGLASILSWMINEQRRLRLDEPDEPDAEEGRS